MRPHSAGPESGFSGHGRIESWDAAILPLRPPSRIVRALAKVGLEVRPVRIGRHVVLLVGIRHE